MGVLQQGKAIFYHPLDDGNERLLPATWFGTADHSKNGKIGKAMSRVGTAARLTAPPVEYDQDGGANAVLFITAEEAVVGGAFTESSKSGHTVTVVNSVKSSSVVRVGSNSWNHTANGRYMLIPDHADFDMGLSNFTFDCWIYPTAFANYATIFSTAGDRPSPMGWGIMVDASGMVCASNTNGTPNFVTSGALRVTLNQWSHIALVRKGTGAGDMNIYVNGVAGGSPTTGNLSLDKDTDGIVVGRYYTNENQYYFNCYFDNMRLTKGEALWTGNFTFGLPYRAAAGAAKVAFCGWFNKPSA